MKYLDTIEPSERLGKLLDKDIRPQWLAEMVNWAIDDNGMYFER